jgi:catechol 2,3-dioxygenase-like lactoylglutathione lyase family enzyme
LKIIKNLNSCKKSPGQEDSLFHISHTAAAQAKTPCSANNNNAPEALHMNQIATSSSSTSNPSDGDPSSSRPSAHDAGTRYPNGIHHLAFGTRCSKSTYAFYHDKLGMPLVRTENHRHKKGYFRHYFFDMGRAQYIAFFELQNVGERQDYRVDISTGLGMPLWINHLAFDIGDEEHYQAMKQRLIDHKVTLLGETDHGWCKSLYLVDPNMIMLEFTYTHDAAHFHDQTPEEAYRLLFDVPAEQIEEESRKDESQVKKVQQ